MIITLFTLGLLFISYKYFHHQENVKQSGYRLLNLVSLIAVPIIAAQFTKKLVYLILQTFENLLFNIAHLSHTINFLHVISNSIAIFLLIIFALACFKVVVGLLATSLINFVRG